MLGFMRKHARSSFIKIIFWMHHRRVRLLGRRRDGRRRRQGERRGDGRRRADHRPDLHARLRAHAARLPASSTARTSARRSLAQLNLQQRALDDLVTEMLLKREAAPPRPPGHRRRGPRGHPRRPDLPGRRPLRPRALPARAPGVAPHPGRVRGVAARDRSSSPSSRACSPTASPSSDREIQTSTPSRTRRSTSRS